MCIVPVRVRHETWQEEESKIIAMEVEVYAMLDECSEGTFISEDLLDWFEEGMKRKTAIHVETVNHSGLTDAYAVKGLIVRGSKEFGAMYKLEDVRLPETFSQEKLPMDREDVLTAETLAEWNHLKEVMQTLPGVKDIPLGLLIGNNCPRAQEPMEVIASKEDGPYAKRTRLGWCVSAPMREEGSSRLKCSNVKVCRTLVKDNSINHELQAMWREDFVEKESEKRSLSKEDRLFLQEMKESITFSEGHYVLPLPLRVQVDTSAEEDMEGGSTREKVDWETRGKDGQHKITEKVGYQSELSKLPGKLRNAK